MLLLILIAIIAVFCAILVYKNLYKPLKVWENLKIPHLKAYPLIGNMGPFLMRKRSFADLLKDLYFSQPEKTRYFGFQHFLTPTLMIKDIELIKQITIKEFDHFVDHRKFISEEIDPIFGKNLFALGGEKWRRMRSTLSPAFTGSKMRAMFTLISECANDFINHFTEKASPNKPLVVELKDLFSRISNDVIASFGFGIKCDSFAERENEFFMTARESTNFNGVKILKFMGYSISPTLMDFFSIGVFNEKTRNYFRSLVVNNMRIREEQKIFRPDMIHLLMEARKGQLNHDDIKSSAEDSAGFATAEESDVGKNSKMAQIDLSDDDVTAQVISLIVGGAESIPSNLSHACFELAINQDCQRKLHQEIDATLKEYKGKITYEAIMKMKYLDMVISETLRKWPVSVFLDRICTDEYEIKPTMPNEESVTLKKNTSLWIPVFALQRDPKYFPNPEKFDPERFSDENKRNILPYSYIPFGVGPRNCIGSRLALLQVKILLFYFLSRFELQLCEKSVVPLQLSRISFNMVAEDGFWLGLKLRNNK